jgi:hypothetical protein
VIQDIAIPGVFLLSFLLFASIWVPGVRIPAAVAGGTWLFCNAVIRLLLTLERVDIFWARDFTGLLAWFLPLSLGASILIVRLGERSFRGREGWRR